ncbi:MAG: DUF1932 domain-containing protein [Anaerolineae bacterium]|nr:DUF1932 domain-containing protein [Anaerolineae bacterium]
MKVGILHPGEMGVSIAATIKNSGHEVYWVSAGRSASTQARAEKVGLRDAHSLQTLCDTCAWIVSVCPPEAAEDLARQVHACGFRGAYLDANAISPQKAVRINDLMQEAGARFVDGSIIGGPAWTPHSTWLYLAGPDASEAVTCFAAGPLETSIVSDTVGQASALKMCFAAYSKGTTALLSAILATAEALEVRGALEQQWSRNGSEFAEETTQRVRQVTAKAWRFAGEMDEIAATLREAGMPGEFHQAAAEIYRRMAGFKDADPTPALDAVLDSLLRGQGEQAAPPQP